MTSQQVYDPFGSMLASTLLAAMPAAVTLGFSHIEAHFDGNQLIGE